MAVKSTLIDSALTLKYKEGVDSNGKDIIKTKKFSNIKVTATDENVYAVAAAFSPLMKYPVMQSLRTNDNALTNI
jgi:N-dimethylarginine dimethylaminohydrolase